MEISADFVLNVETSLDFVLYVEKLWTLNNMQTHL